MRLHGGFLWPPAECRSKMHVCVCIGTPPQIMSHLCLLILSGLALSSQRGLEEVFFSPRDQTVREGESVSLRCVSGDSSVPASITWLKDGHLVTRGRQIQGEYGGGDQKKTSGTLHLFNVTREDDGTYVCVTYNPSLNISKRSKPAKLSVQGIPRRLRIIQGPENITVAVGTETSMQCTVRGFPVPMVRWFKGDCLLENGSALLSVLDNGQLLTFRNVTREDEGFYHCEASNLKDRIKSKPAYLLPAEMDWVFTRQPENTTARQGANVTLSCGPPRSRPPAQVSWFKNNRLILRAAALPSEDLLLYNVQEDDSGSYFCRASNTHLQRFLTSRRAVVTVHAPPSVKLWPRALTVPLGARAALQCEVSGHPLPSISWIKRGQSRQTGGRIALGRRNATLNIQSARSYDEGDYVCEASNALGHSSGTATLTVAVSPVIVTLKSRATCGLGAAVLLPCRAVGVPPIAYVWSRNKSDPLSLETTAERHVDEEGTLHISGVQLSDAGEYYCTAQNRAGRHQMRSVLVVTAEDRQVDRGVQTGPVLSAGTNSSLDLQRHTLANPLLEQQVKKTSPLHIQSEEFLCPSSLCDPTQKKGLSRGNQPGTTSSHPPITHLHPPLLPPPPRPHFQSTVSNSRLPVTRDPPPFFNPTSGHVQYELPERPSHLRVRRLQQPVKDGSSEAASSKVTEPTTEMFMAQSQLPTSQPSVRSSTVMLRFPSQNERRQLMSLSSSAPGTRQTSATSRDQSSQTLTRVPPSSSQPSLGKRLLPKFQLDVLQSTPPPPNLVAKPPLAEASPRIPTSTSSTSPTPHPQLYSRTVSPKTFTYPLQHGDNVRSQSRSPAVFSASLTTDPSQSNPGTFDGREVSVPNQLNTSQTGGPTKPDNDTKPMEWLKRNTSQSPISGKDPRVTQQSPSWLPVLEKRDIPIVVGVGVSLAFIFITVTFYSVIQKNEPAPTSRAAQRNLGVPLRHAERRAARRTYENRAFEDDECVGVIEQSSNTTDTRARPPGPSLVTMQMEPASENLQENMPPPLDNQTITVETYPEPVLDTKIDSSLEEEKSCSLQQPSIQLQCADDWPSIGGDNHSSCPDTLNPPSTLPSRSPSPSPTPHREEGLRSSLTLHSPEAFVAPLHHSLSITHGNSPLLLSQHLTYGLTTVTVDVHLYPAATVSNAVGTGNHINSVSNFTSVATPLFSPPLSNSQENEQSNTRLQ